MGQTTPNIGIYIPSAGETNYDASFAAGQVNIDQHDHSGGPNKGVPIASGGLADGSVTYPKLATNVADNSTGIGTAGAAGANQLSILGLLKNIYQIATTTGFIAKNGSLANARTIQGTANQVTVTNGDGASGDPVISLPTSFYDGGTFTPTVNTSNNDIGGGVTYILQDGNWQKVGKWIFIDLEVVFSGGAGTGNVIIQGLPVASVGTYWFAGYTNGATSAPNQQVMAFQTSGSNVLIFPNGTSNTQLAAPGGPYGFNFQMTGMYQWTF